LGARRAELKRALTEVLCAPRLFDFDGAPLPFNFSLGPPLAEQALVADALALLRAGARHLEFGAIVRLCRSPYFGAPEERAMRFALEAVLRREGYAQFTLRDWQWLAQQHGCPQWSAALARYR